MGLSYILIASFLLGWSSLGTAQLACQRAVGGYRDCTCGVQYRDVEERCCNSQTCLQPFVFTENMTCPFQCLNNGTYNSDVNLCQCTEGRYGLCCENETPTCGRVLLESQGEIISPSQMNFNWSDLPEKRKCVWTISTSSNRRIALGPNSISNFSIDESACLLVHDGADSVSPIVGSYCNENSSHFQTVYSTGRHLHIELVSNTTESSSEFHLRYVTFLNGQGCGPWPVYRRPTATLTSPQYPLPYRPSETCMWQIVVAPDSNLVLTVLDIDITCSGDSLQVGGIDGSAFFPIVDLCGVARGSAFIISGISPVFIAFTSRNSTESNIGFSIRYEQIFDF